MNNSPEATPPNSDGSAPTQTDNSTPLTPDLWNQTDVFYTSDARTHVFITRKALETPDAIALKFEEQTLTYRELNERANQLAHYLQRHGAGPDKMIGLSVYRSIEMVVGLIGIWKSGAAYVPMDPEYPKDRVAFMFEDAAPPVLLTQAHVLPTLPAYTGKTLCLDTQWDEVARESKSEPLDLSTQNTLAYMIYTSGSTGKPKGALNNHHGVCNQLLWMQERYQLKANESVLQKTPFSFDVSVWEFFWPLMVGARLVIARPGGHQDPSYLVNIIRKEGIHSTAFVPSMLRAFLDEPNVAQCTTLRDTLCIGEALTYDLQERFLRTMNGDLHNLYGPTEAAVSVTHWTCRRDSKSNIVPIGQPCANTYIYVLDEKLNQLPVGETGELWIGGVQVGRGYHNRPDLSAERFIKDPFSKDPKGKMYKTGDLARWLPDGTIDYLGRIDFQVKMRGFRIELGEIECILALHPDVQQAVVVADRRPDRDDRLVSYLSARGERRPAITELREHILARLPEYMVPALFIWLPEIPLSPNGKVDRKALPAPKNERPALSRAFVAPRTPLEKQLAKIWGEFLDLDQVGVDDSFFELGGTSLAAVRMVTSWQKHSPLELPLVKVFQYPTIAALAFWLENKDTGKGFIADQERRAAKALAGRNGSQTPIAIVGMAGRFPGAPDIDTLWQNLVNGVESITTFKREEMGIGIDETLRNDPDYIPARGIIDGAEYFDAAFFGIGALEASVMDPQQRVFLEIAYEALEKAGYDPDRPPGAIGVFAGSGDNRYYPINLLSNPKILARAGKLAVEYGNEKDYMAMRVSYLLGLTGPSVSSNTGCSSALLAVDQAVRALADYECDMALAGGIDIGIPQKSGFLYEEGGTFAKDGHCRPFDAEATGTMFCDGAGIVVLKRLDDALAAGDTIHAVVRGTAKNNNGARTASFLAPSVEGQSEVIAMAQANAGVPIDTIGYVEAHGTGTPVGDPIEIEALNEVFSAKTDKRAFSYLGSIKGNIGHPTSAAGIAGFIKAALVLEKELIPGTQHFKKLNPKINLENSPFRIADKLIPYPRTTTPRRAAVSSFGFGGTNLHAILEEPPLVPAGGPTRKVQLITISARTPAALEAYAESLAKYFEGPAEFSLADAASTLLRGRKQWPHRRFVVAADRKEAAEQLRKPNPLKGGTRHNNRRNPAITFLFGGQGTQYINMGHDLYQEEPLFKAIVDECCDLLKPHLGRDLRELLYPKKDDEATARESLQNTFYTQPAIFTIEYALARWWQSVGVLPSLMSGHSIGEFVAATLAGVFELSDVLRVVAARGRLMQSMPAGSMLSVRAPAAEVEPLLPDNIQMGAVNGPTLCVIAGPTDVVNAFQPTLEAKGWVCKHLHTSHAFHSAMMEPILPALREEFKTIKLKAPNKPLISTVTGVPLTDEQATDPDYWTRHARRTVRFSNAAQWLVDNGNDLFLECGPRSTMSTLTRQHVPKGKVVAAIPSLGESVETIGELGSMFVALGALWAQGVPIDWEAFYAHEQRRRIPLPTYPFERQRYWVEPAVAVAATAAVEVPSIGLEAQYSPAEAAHEVTPVVETKTRRELIADRLLEIIAPIAGREAAAIDRTTTFLEQGFDSLLLVQVTAALRNELSVKVGFSLLMNQYPNVELLVAHLETVLPATSFVPTTNVKTAVTTGNAGRPAAAGGPLSSAGPRAAVPAAASATAPSTAICRPADDDLRAVVEAQGRNIERILSLLESRTPALARGPAPSDVILPAAAPSSDALPSTLPQRGIFLSSLLNERLSASYNESATVWLKGTIDVEKLSKALQRLAVRHDALRASFDDSGASMRIAPSVAVPVQRIAVPDTPDEARRAAVETLIRNETEKPFPLPGGPLFRVVVASAGSNEAAVILTAHHVVCDGWGLDVLIHDLCAFYSEELSGVPANLKPVKSYGDYLRYSAERETSDELTEARRHYETKFASGFPVLVLPTKAERSNQRAFTCRRDEVVIPPSAVEGLRAFAAQHRCSLFATVLAAYSVTLARASGQRHFVIALPTAEQPVLGQTYLVGHCVNMLPFEVDLRQDRPFTSFLAEVSSQLSQAHGYAAFTATHILSRLRPVDPKPGVRPISAGLTSTQKWKLTDLAQKGFTVDFEFNPRRFESFEFYLTAFERGPELALRINFDTGLFDENRVAGWIKDLETVLLSLPARPSVAVHELLASGAPVVAQDILFMLSDEATASAPAITPSSSEHTTDANAIEPYVLDLWKRVLKVKAAGLDDNFFDAGGHSLSAAELFAEIKRDIDLTVPFTFFYTNAPTPRALAVWIRESNPSSVPKVASAPATVQVGGFKGFLRKLGLG